MFEVIALATLLQSGPPSYVGQWSVEMVDHIKVMPDSRVTLTIDAPAGGGLASISGSSSCNTYHGTFAVHAENVVRVTGLLKTMKACDPARMSEEADFFAILGQAASYELRGTDTLIVRSADGKTITARRSTPPSAP